jgi:AcrR family transcriptional regulator
VEGVLAERRARILRAMVLCAAERGYAGTTVRGVCARARVSHDTFYETFDGLRGCFLAVLDDGYDRARALISQAFADQDDWREGIRSALGSLLLFFDEQPLLARVWLVESLAAGSWALERRERHVRALTQMIVTRWPLPPGVQLNPLAPAAVMELTLGIIHTQLLRGSREPLVALLPLLMGLINAIHRGVPAATLEIQRAREHTHGTPTQQLTHTKPVASDAKLPRALLDPRAYRARQCLHYLLEHPGASNQQIAHATGIAQPAQASKLLTRLRNLGLLTKHNKSPGGPNAWTLTPHGTLAIHVLENDTSGPSCPTVPIDPYTFLEAEPSTNVR